VSRAKGITIEDIPSENYVPKLKWVNGKKGREKGHFVFSVLDTYTKDGSFYNVEISEEDVWRMINADRGTKYGFWFSFENEQDDLPDDAYLGISYLQARYYLSVSVLREAKRAWKRGGKTGWNWVVLKRRAKRGGRPVGGGKSKGFASLPKSEQERLLSLSANYEKIVNNCYKKDWVTEYVELQRDLCLLKGTKFPGKKRIIAEFTEARKKWLEENG